MAFQPSMHDLFKKDTKSKILVSLYPCKKKMHGGAGGSKHASISINEGVVERAFNRGDMM